MPPPAKRQRLSTSDAYDNVPGIQEQRRRNELRLKSRFEAIYDKYDRDFTGIGDVIDMNTGQIVVDNGHLRGMRHERDLGVDKIGPKPAVKSTNPSERKSKDKKVDDTQRIRKREQDEHDELSSPPPRTVVADVEEIPLVFPAEGAWAKPEELNDPIPQEPLAQPIDIEETAQLVSRITAQIAPSPQGQIVLDTTSMAFIISEVTRGLQRQQNQNRVIAAPKPATLLTPPASERAGPIKKLSSVWREDDEGEEQSEDEGEEGQIEAEVGQTVKYGEDEAPVTAMRRRFQPAEDIEILRMKGEGLSYSDIAKQLSRQDKSIRKRYILLENKGFTKAKSIIESTTETGRSRRTTINLPVVNDKAEHREESGPIAEKPRRRTRQSLPSTAVTSTKPFSETITPRGTKSQTSPFIKRRSTRRSIHEAGQSLPLTSPKCLVVLDSEGAEEPLETESNMQPPLQQTLLTQDLTNIKTRRRSGRSSAQSIQVASLVDPEAARSITTKSNHQDAASIVESSNSLTDKATIEQNKIPRTSPPVTESHQRQTTPSKHDRRRSQRFSHVEIVVNPLPPQAERGMISAHTAVASVGKTVEAETGTHPSLASEVSLLQQTHRPVKKSFGEFKPHNSIETSGRRWANPRGQRPGVQVMPAQPSSASKAPAKLPSVILQDDLGSEDELGF